MCTKCHQIIYNFLKDMTICTRNPPKSLKKSGAVLNHTEYTRTPHAQLKNMVSALFQSRSPERGGTRDFQIGKVHFGWSVLEDLYSRETGRIQSGQCSRVPKLKKSHIVRDSWTRLNVQPSKVMQVN